MSTPELSVEAQQALAATKLGDLKKKVNAAGWSDNMEELLKSWGEKSAGLRFMHNKAGSYWKGVGNRLTLWGILITTAASTVSLVATNIDDPDSKNTVLFAVGGLGMVSSLIQSFKKFYNAEEKNADHSAIAKQFGSFYRYIVLQMGMSREDRVPADELTSWALKEFERLQQDSPPLGDDAITAFKNTFTNPSQAVPDVCEDEFIIEIFGREENKILEVPDNSVNVVNSRTQLEIEVDSS